MRVFLIFLSLTQSWTAVAQDAPPMPRPVLTKILATKPPGQSSLGLVEIGVGKLSLDDQGQFYSFNVYEQLIPFNRFSVLQRTLVTGGTVNLSPQFTTETVPCPPNTPPGPCFSSLGLAGGWAISPNGQNVYYAAQRVDIPQGQGFVIKSISINDGPAESSVLYDLQANGYGQALFQINDNGLAVTGFNFVTSTNYFAEFGVLYRDGTRSLPPLVAAPTWQAQFSSIAINNLDTAFFTYPQGFASEIIYAYRPATNQLIQVGQRTSSIGFPFGFYASNRVTPAHPEGILYYAPYASSSQILGTDGSVFLNFPSGQIRDFHMNEKDQYIFTGVDSQNHWSVYSGPDPDANLILGPGDVLDGKVVTFARAVSINNHGQFVVQADFSDFTLGIYRGSLNQETCLSMDVSLAEIYPMHPNGNGPNQPNKTTVMLKYGCMDVEYEPGELAGKVISLSSEAVEFSGGHNHSNVTPERPVGSFAAPQCTTGPTGECSVTYTASAVSGSEELYAFLEEDHTIDAMTEVLVRVPGLVKFADSLTYRLTGKTDYHPNNHYLSQSPQIQISVFSVAFEYVELFQGTLGLNDMSLEFGGLFDIGPASGPFWSTPHISHRIGKSVDINKCSSDITDDDNGLDRECRLIQTGVCPEGCTFVERPAIKKICETFGGQLQNEVNYHCEF